MKHITKQHGRTLLEMLAVLAIIGVLSITALVGFTYAMNKHRANETIYDVMLRGTNVPMIDEYYFKKDVGHEFRFPGLVNNGRQGTYYPMTTKKDSGSSYYVEATGVTYRVCELILKMNPTDIDQIVVNNSVYTGDSDICGNTDGLALRFCFGTDGTICNGTGGGSGGSSGGTSGGSGSGSSGSGSGTTDPCEGMVCQHGGSCLNGICSCVNGYTGTYCEIEPDKCKDTVCSGCQKCDPLDGNCKDDNNQCSNGQTCSDGICVCSDNAQCPDGEICQDGSCITPECLEDKDCTSPQVCSNNKCVCPTIGTVGICQEIIQDNGCDVIQDMADGSSCVVEGKEGSCQSGECIPKGCVTDEDCLNGEICSNGICCPSNQININGVCATPEMTKCTSCKDSQAVAGYPCEMYGYIDDIDVLTYPLACPSGPDPGVTLLHGVVQNLHTYCAALCETQGRRSLSAQEYISWTKAGFGSGDRCAGVTSTEVPGQCEDYWSGCMTECHNYCYSGKCDVESKANPIGDGGDFDCLCI